MTLITVENKKEGFKNFTKAIGAGVRNGKLTPGDKYVLVKKANELAAKVKSENNLGLWVTAQYVNIFYKQEDKKVATKIANELLETLNGLHPTRRVQPAKK